MLKGYKTIIFNAVMGLIMLVRAVMPDVVLPDEAEVNSTLDSLLANADAIITVIGNLWLRFVTTTPVFKDQ